MPVTYRFDSNIIVILEMIGEYSTDEIRTTVLKSLADPECPTNPFLLINLSESRSIYSRSPEQVKTISLFIASLGERFNNRIALVARKDLPYGMMRMGSVGSEERGIASEVFRTVDEARKWILG